MIMPLGQTVLAHAVGPNRMGRVMSIIGVPLLLAPIIGPVIGGLLVEAVGWRWIFFVNMPVATLAFLLAIKLLPRASRRGVQRGSTSSAPASSRAASRSSSTPQRDDLRVLPIAGSVPVRTISVAECPAA
jgi:MFS family permease